MKKPTAQTGKAADPWEVERLHQEFPVKSREELEETLTDCKEKAEAQQDKEKLTRCVQRKLSK